MLSCTLHTQSHNTYTKKKVTTTYRLKKTTWIEKCLYWQNCLFKILLEQNKFIALKKGLHLENWLDWKLVSIGKPMFAFIKNYIKKLLELKNCLYWRFICMKNFLTLKTFLLHKISLDTMKCWCTRICFLFKK